MGLEGAEGNVIYLHTKKAFIEKWARKFVKVYNDSGKDVAIGWAMEFLDKEAVGPVAARARQLLGKT